MFQKTIEKQERIKKIKHYITWYSVLKDYRKVDRFKYLLKQAKKLSPHS